MPANEETDLYLPISSLLVKNSSTLNSETLHKVLSVDFLGLDVYYPSLKITLSIDNGQFSVSGTTSAIKLSADKKSVTLNWDENLRENFKKISVKLDSSFSENVNNGLYLKTTMNLSVNDKKINKQYAKKIYITADDYDSSFFASGNNKYSFINGIKGLTKNSFKNNIYTNKKVVDAEKNDYLNVKDDNLCWAASASNMLTWTKWADKALNTSSYNGDTEDLVFSQFKGNFSDKGSSPYYGIQWFFNGEYPNDFDSSWSKPKNGSGNYLNTSPDKYLYFDNGIDNFIAYIFSGDAVSLAIETDDYSGHAITCWGIEYNSNYKVNNTNWLTGIYITDSDDSKNLKNPPDELLYVKVTWSKDRKQYKLDKSYSSYNYYIQSFTALSRVYPSNFNTEDTREIIEVKNKKTSSNQTIATNELQIVRSGGVASSTVINGGESYVFSGGKAFDAIVQSGKQMVIGVASNVTVKSGANLYISNSGQVLGATIEFGANETISSGVDKNASVYGKQNILAKGSAYSATINSGGVQNIKGYAKATEINSGGTANVNAGKTSSLIVNDGAILKINSGFDYNTVVQGGGKEYVLGSAIATKINENGFFELSSGGYALTITISKNALENICSKASDYNAKIFGEQVVSLGGNSVSARISNGGLQTVYGKSTNAIVFSGGRVVNQGSVSGLTISANGYESISGNKTVDSNAKIWGLQEIYGGLVYSAQIKKGGEQIIFNGSSINAQVSSGGKLTASGGTISGMCIVAGGILATQNNAKLSNLVLKKSATCNLDSTVTISGTNIFNDSSKIIGGSEDRLIKFAKNAVINLTKNVDMSNAFLDVASTSFVITGNNNKFSYIALDNNTKFTYNISAVTVNDKNYMLNLGSKINQADSNNQIIVQVAQGIGLYRLSQNLIQSKNTSYVIKQGNTTIGTAKLNGKTLTKNGVTYKLKSSGDRINLTLSLKAGKILKNNGKNSKLTGNTDSDIFYGGKGNDVITGKNGRDVSVYDTNSWGKDTIKKTSGTMIVLFNGLTKSKIKTSLKGSTMTISKASDDSQKITLEGWGSNTHSIVFTNGLSAFSKYLKTASPTTKQVSSARSEIWKKSGLAAS